MRYVDYLNGYGYPSSNFIGIYIHPSVSTSILLRYKVDNKFVSLVTTTNNIQKILTTLSIKPISSLNSTANQQKSLK